MTTYLLQIQTSNTELQLRTEVTVETVEQLQYESKKMVKANPAVIGKQYLIAMYTKRPTGGYNVKTVKTGVVTGR